MKPNSWRLPLLAAGSTEMADNPTKDPLDVLADLKHLVDEQAEDEGLWFLAATAPEAYLQQELRRLHAAIEGAVPEGIRE